MEQKKNQFQLKTLFGVVTCIAVLSATANWVMEKDVPSDLWRFPFLFFPSIPLMGIGITLVPIVFLIMLIFSFILTLRSHPRAFLSVFFFGCVPLVCGLDSLESAGAVRWLVSMSAGSVAWMAESLIRRLPKEQLIAAMVSVGIPVGAYLYLISAIAIAGV